MARGPGGGGKDAGMQPGGGCGTPEDQEGCDCASAGQSRACWTGPVGARGVGVCRDGAQLCTPSAEFATYGACAGSVLPSHEVCTGGLDEDCDGAVDCKDSDCATDAACVPECQAGATMPCYSGPGGTSGVGACKPGKRTCDASGKWGACVGEVLPGADESLFAFNCMDSVDNDCDGIKDCMEFGCLLAQGCSPTICTAGQSQACYSGPAGTQGVGPCHGGMQICASDGKSWGPCMNQVLPGNEALACTDGVDNDCNGKIDCADPACSTAPNCCTPQPGTPPDTTIWANSPTDLYKVDPTTFALTHVGSFGVTDMTDIAVTPAGEIYGISFTTLYKIDKLTAKASSLASLGSGNNGLTFLPNGSLLASDGAGDLKSINPANGQITHVGNFGDGLSSSGDLVAVGSVMYAISSTGAGGSDASDDNVLLRIDIVTGKATIVGPIGFGKVWGLAYANKKVIAFNTSGQVIQIDPATGKGSLLATRNVQFWGAGMSPNVPANTCP